MPIEKWLEISIRVSSANADLIAEYLSPLSYGGAIVEQEVLSDEEEGNVLGHSLYATIKLYSLLEQGPDEMVSVVTAKTQEILPTEDFLVTYTEIKEEEWSTSWKAWFKPIKVGPLIVTAPWIKKKDHRGLIPVVIDPGMAFGTGSHATTRLCLRGIVDHLRPGDRVLDAGTGSGILAIAAGKLGASFVFAFDVDEVAVKDARRNIEANELSNLIDAEHCSISDISPEMSGSFDLVVANISSRTVAILAQDLRAQLKDGGTLIVSGVSSTNLKLVEESLREAGMVKLKVNRQGDWRSITCRRG